MTQVRTAIGVFPTDGSTFDIVAPGITATCTGCVVIALEAVNLDENDSDLVVSFGVTDFTTVGQISAADEHGQTATDAHVTHQSSTIIAIPDAGTSNIDRSANAAAIVGGIRLTPVESSGVAHRVMAILVFGSACTAFTDNGDGSMAVDETQTIAHGMTTAPGAGIYGFNNRVEDADTVLDISIGFHSYDDSTIKQACFGQRRRNALTTTEADGQMMSDRVGFQTDNSGGAFNERELTTVNATNVIYTNRGAGASSGDLIGLLIECKDVLTDVLVVDSLTTAASAWNYNGLSFTSQFVAMVLNRATAIDTAISNTEAAGTMGLCAFDEDSNIFTASWASEQGIALDPATTNTQTRLSQALYNTDDDGTVDFDMDTIVFTSDGWDVASGDINTADGTIRRWPMLAIQKAGSVILRRRRT